jgi:hypothetical protein
VSGERDPLRDAFGDLAGAPPPADLADRIRAEVRSTPQRGRSFTWPAGLAAAAVVVLALVVGGLPLGRSAVPMPAGTQTASPPDQGSSDPLASRGPDGLQADDLARATAAFTIGGLGVEIGQTVWIVGGPLEHDGVPSYLIQHFGDLETGYRPGGVTGWLPATTAVRDLVERDPACPSDTSLAAVAALQPFERVVCFGWPRELTFEPVTARDRSYGGNLSTRWISTDGQPDFLTGLPVDGLTPALAMPDDGWFRVTGHFDDPAAFECGEPEAVATCRERFIVTAVTPVEPPDTVLRGTWRQTALPPIDGRTEFAMAWTGAEAIVWGGVSSSEAQSVFEGVLRRDGAAYDPATDRWRVIPEAPIAGRSNPLMAWTGSEIVVFGGMIGDSTQLDGAAWNPATNTWRTIRRSPLTGRDARGAWLADRLIVLTSDSAATYDPAVDRWTTLPAAPVRANRSVAVAADRLVVVAFGDDLMSPADWAVLDPRAGTWRTGTLPIDPLKASAGFVGAKGVIVEPTTGQVFDPIAERWSTIPICEAAGYGSVWTGSVVLGTRGASDLDRCWQLPPAPPREPPFDNDNGREFPAAVWTGSQYFTWSGGNGGDIVWVPKDGAVFTPENDLGPCCG